MFVYYHAGILQDYFTGVGIPHFTGQALAKLVFPLPPIAEQRRIVAKVKELFTLCEQLETNLAVIQAESHNLLDSVLYGAISSEAQ
jgi:type I restriction enzyme S subunit